MSLQLLKRGVVLILTMGFGLSLAARTDGDYERPTPEETLAFLKSCSPVWGGGGKGKLGNRWTDKTADDIRTMKKVKIGGHVEAGPHLLIKPDEWRYLTAFAQMEEADFNELQGRGGDRIFYHLGNLPQTVTTLKVEIRQPTGKGAKHLANLKNLRNLTLGISDTPLGDQIIAQLSKIRSLERLDITCEARNVKGAGVALLSKLRTLKSLKIFFFSINDSALGHFGRLSVEELDLSKPFWLAKSKDHKNEYKITSGGIKKLLANRRNLPNLRKLTLRGVPFAAQVAGELQSLRPGLQVVR